MKRSKPLARSQKPIRKRRKVRLKSMKHDVIDGTYQKWPDGREVCLSNSAGDCEYRARLREMADRQEWKCGIPSCKFFHILMHMMNDGTWFSATFQHGDGRGLGGARRDDRIDHPGNCAAHWICNSEAGSKRLTESDRVEG